MGGKPWGKQRTQYSVVAEPAAAVATMAWSSSTSTVTVCIDALADVLGWSSALVAPVEAVMETVRAFVPAAQRT